MQSRILFTVSIILLSSLLTPGISQESNDKPTSTIITSIAGKTESGRLSIDHLRSIENVQAMMIDDNGKSKMDIVSFAVSTEIKGDVVEVLCRGEKLNADAQKLLDSAMEGEFVRFEHIKVKHPDSPGVVRAAPPMEFELF